MTRQLVFVDIESTGLDSDRHEIVELAWAVADGPVQVVRPRHTLRNAEQVALQINGYHQRLAGAPTSTPDQVSQFVIDVRGNTVVAANPPFDCGFLRTHFGFAPWHYRVCDIESFAAGVLGLPVPPSLKDIRARLTELGHAIPEPDHSAGGDVEAMRGCFQALRAEQATTLQLRAELAGMLPPAG